LPKAYPKENVMADYETPSKEEMNAVAAYTADLKAMEEGRYGPPPTEEEVERLARYVKLLKRKQELEGDA
jgi:hypothetical protein